MLHSAILIPPRFFPFNFSYKQFHLLNNKKTISLNIDKKSKKKVVFFRIPLVETAFDFLLKH